MQQTQKSVNAENVQVGSCIYDKELWLYSITDPLMLAEMQILLVRKVLFSMSLHSQGTTLAVEIHKRYQLDGLKKYFASDRNFDLKIDDLCAALFIQLFTHRFLITKRTYNFQKFTRAMIRIQAIARMLKGKRLAEERRNEYREMMKNKAILALQAYTREIKAEKRYQYTKQMVLRL